MITKSNFVNIILKIQEYERFVDKVSDYVNIDKFDELFAPGEIQDMFFKSLFTEKQVDLINAYLYDYDDFLNQVDEDIATPEELYDYLVKNDEKNNEL